MAGEGDDVRIVDVDIGCFFANHRFEAFEL